MLALCALFMLPGCAAALVGAGSLAGLGGQMAIQNAWEKRILDKNQRGKHDRHGDRQGC